MYEEKKFKEVNWIPLLIKAGIIISVIIIVIIIISITTNNTKNDSFSELYRNNMNEFKQAATNYFIETELPSKTGDTIQIELSKLIEEKSILDFTNNGKSCNQDESYASATKVDNNNYSLKIFLSCNSKEDYIISNINTSEKIAIEIPTTENANEVINVKTSLTTQMYAGNSFYASFDIYCEICEEDIK